MNWYVHNGIIYRILASIHSKYTIQHSLSILFQVHIVLNGDTFCLPSVAMVTEVVAASEEVVRSVAKVPAASVVGSVDRLPAAEKTTKLLQWLKS